MDVKKKPHSKGQWIFIGLAAVGMVSCIASGQAESERQAADRAAAEAQKTPEQKIAEEKAKVAAEEAKKKTVEEARTVAFYAAALKKSMKNPDSFDLTSAGVMEGGAICYEYRATNSFNAVVPDILVVTKSKTSKDPRDWNKFCAGKSWTNYTYVKQLI